MANIFPGTPQHQALLDAFVSYYRDDPRIVALTLFGSLSRGNWDELSDIDLNVVIRDDMAVDVIVEVTALCTAFETHGETAALIVPDRQDAADVVFDSLLELSIRYHRLADTSPNIIESLRLLSGHIGIETIQEAGRKNRRIPTSVVSLLDTAMRLIVAADRTLHRGQFWQTLSLTERLRGLLVEIFAREQGKVRAFPTLDTDGRAAWKEELAATLSQGTLSSVQNSFLRLLEMIERQPGLTQLHAQIIGKVRYRQTLLMPTTPDNQEL